MANTIEIKVGLDTKQADAQLLGFQRRFKGAIDPAITSAASLRSAVTGATAAFAAFAVAGLAAAGALKKFAEISIDAALQVNKQVNALKALTGSAEAAEKRFAALFALAQKTPGLTTSLAATLDAQLRIFSVTEKTIDKLLPVIGRLNAISPLGDPKQFVNNFTQLITQNFERQDLKELVGQSPIAGLLIKQIFNVDNPTNAEAIRAAAKKLGVTTVERLAEELIKAAGTNSALKNATESLAGQFEKLEDRITVALAPIGEELLKTLLPAFKELVEILERDLPKITDLLRRNKDELLILASAFISVASAVGSLIGAFNQLDQKLGIIRALTVMAVALARPESVGAVITAFGRLDTVGPRGGDIRVSLPPDTGGVTDLNPPIPGDISRAILRSRGINPRDLSDAQVLKLVGGSKSSAVAGETGATKKSELQKAIEETKQLTELVKALKANEGKLFEEEFKQLQLKIERDQLIKQLKDRATRAVLTAQGKPLPPQLPGGIGLPRGLSLAGFGGPNLGGLPALTAIAPDAADALDATQTRFALAEQTLRIQEVRIQNQVTAGLLSQAEAQRALAAARGASRAELIALLEAQRQHVGLNTIEGLQIAEQIEQMQLLGVELSDTTRFMVGFNSQIETSGDAFERFGQNVSRAFTNIKDVFGSLKNAVFQFFNDILGQGLQNLMRQVLGPIFSGGSGGGGVGNFFGNLFRGGSFGGGGNLTAPPSVSLSGLGGLFSGGRSAAAGGLGGLTLDPLTAKQLGVGGTSFLGGLGQSFAAAAPLLGLTLGASLGGQSRAGNILGGIGGTLGGLVLGASTGAIGGSLGSAFALSGALGPLALAAAPALLLGGFFLGRAKQRGRDEEAAGQMLLQAQEGIRQLKAGIANDSIDGSQARAIFDRDILGQFISGINTLKTRSVRESRLTNQTADLRKFYDSLIPMEITAQLQRRQNVITHSKLIPEFATGGISRGGLAFMHENEMVLTMGHQSLIRAIAGSDIFKRVGVPGIQKDANFDRGGIMPSGQPSGDIIIEKLIVGISAEDVFVAGGSGARGRRVIVKQTEFAMRKGELS